MPRSSESPPIPIAAATPWVWEGAAREITYQVRFYRQATATDDLPQTGGVRLVTVTATRPRWYSAEDVTTTHTSTLANAPPTNIPAGQETLLGLGTGQQRVTFTAGQVTEPANATHYRILVTW